MVLKRSKNKLIGQPGQGLVELIVAIAIIEIGLFSVWSLFLINFNAEREAELRITGVNLAREGMEVIKNIRDSNWLKRSLNQKINENIWTWDQNLDSGVYSINFDSLVLDDAKFKTVFLNSNNFFTNIKTDFPTPFSRSVFIKDICCDDANDDLKCDNIDFFSPAGKSVCDLKIGINAVVEVNWIIAGKARKVTIEDYFYDWQ